MRKLFISTIFVFIFVTVIFCAPVSEMTIRRVAQNISLERSGQTKSIASIEFMNKDSKSLIYLVNLQPQGFVLLSADDAALPVLGYDFQTIWSDDNLPIQLVSLIDTWKAQLKHITDNSLSADAFIRYEWQRLSRDTSTFVPQRNDRDVSPLITSIWGQGTYYNAQCPTGTPVGCVATAMSQIMRYWAHPVTGQGSHSYVHPVYGTQSADFSSTVYNWASMPNSINSHNSAVATICRHTGVSVDMDYAPEGSGAYSFDVPSALTSYFKYKSTVQYRTKSSYSAENWDILMRGELNNARPIYYSGYGGSGGHAFILDGFTGTYPSTTYHVNWGWYGYYNGYYALTALNPGSDTFNSNQAAVTGIEPQGSSSLLSEGFEGTTFPPTDWTRSHVQWTRNTTTLYVPSGSASAMCSGTSNQNGKRLRTPLLTIDGTIPITFKGMRATTSQNEAITVQYSSDGNTWNNLSTFTLTNPATTFTQSLASLTPGDYYIGFLTANAGTTGQTKRFIIDDVTGPNLWVDPNPTAALNITSWAAGSLLPGEMAQSGPIFQLANTTGGTLTITSITNLSGTEFSTNINTGVQLVTGQIHEFGFIYEPLNYGADNQVFQIVTNGGTVTINLSGTGAYFLFSDGFESYSNFALSFPPWTQYDGDGSATYGFSGTTFTNSGYTGSYIIFNASQTSPSLAGTAAASRTGEKHAACFAATTPPNNDWLISPAITFAGSPSISFWAKSYNDTYGFERFKVLWSNTGNAVANFGTNYLAGSATTYVSAPTTWTQYSYNLPPACANATVHIAIQCVSNDAFIFMVDDFSASDDSAPAAPVLGHMSGYVYEFGTTNPIANAMVKVGTKEVYTNASGFYQMNNLRVGTHSTTCSTPGKFYFSTTVGGVVIQEGLTTTQNYYLKWAELQVSPTSITSSVYSSQTADIPFSISNPGGTADLSYQMYFSPASTVNNRNNYTAKRLPAMDTAIARAIRPTVFPAPDRIEGWMTYTDPADADYYTYPTPERATKFEISDFGMFSQGVTISKLRHYFYDVDDNNWNGSTAYTLKIYDANGSTPLYTSPTLTAVDWPTANEHILTTPLSVAGDFWVSVVPGNQTNGAPYSIGTSVSVGHTYTGSAGSWTLNESLDLVLMAYIDGSEWVSASQYSGTVVPAGTANLNIHLDSNGLAAGTHNAYLQIYNNSNYIAPSTGSGPMGGDVMVIPISFQVTVPTGPMAILNKTNWTTLTVSSTPTNSGNVFQFKNVGMTNLTITTVTGLTGTPFTTNFNSSVVLAQNQTHDFGFTFSPTASGLYITTVSIVTNGGTKEITLKGYADYITESFEGTNFPPDGWLTIDNDNDTYNWYAYTATGAANTGDKCAGSASWIASRESNREGYRPALTPDNWLITPRLSITDGDEINWYIGAQDPAWAEEYYSVLVSTTTNALFSFTEVLFSETLIDGDWHYRTLDLSDFAGENIFIAFRHHNCTDMFILKLDDVLMPPLAAPLQYGNIAGYVREMVTNNPIVDATVNVGGRTAQTMGDGYYTISNIVAETYQLICSKSGYPGASVSVEIPANGTLNQDINLNWARAIPNQTEFTKEQYVNQSKGYPFTVNNPGTVGLNYTTDSGVWGGDTVLSGNLNQDWEDYNWTGWSGIIGPNTDVYYGYGHEGGESGTFVFESLNCSTTQWLITPQMNVRDGDNFSFWYKQFNNTNEVLNVLVSTDTADTTDFRNTLATIGPMSDTNWTLASYSLNAYTGQNIYIAFYYTKILTQYAYVFIDEITGPEAFLPPMEWLSCSMEEGTIASNATENLSLLVDTNGMQPGHYTAQTWIFSDGVISPVKLYMDLTVSQLLDAEVPQNVAILLDNPVTGDVTISWDTSANAVQYEIYAAPYTTTFENYVHIGSTALTTATISASTLAGFGITGNICMFRITANNENIARFTISRDRQKPVIGLQRMKSPFAGPRTLTVR